MLYFENNPSRGNAPLYFMAFQYFAADATECQKALSQMRALARNG